MLGEFLREAAVLVIVFYPLDLFKHPDKDHPPTVTVHQTFELSLLLLACGIVLEKIDFGAMTVRIIDVAVSLLTRLRNLVTRRADDEPVHP